MFNHNVTQVMDINWHNIVRSSVGSQSLQVIAKLHCWKDKVGLNFEFDLYFWLHGHAMFLLSGDGSNAISVILLLLPFREVNLMHAVCAYLGELYRLNSRTRSCVCWWSQEAAIRKTETSRTADIGTIWARSCSGCWDV